MNRLIRDVFTPAGLPLEKPFHTTISLRRERLLGPPFQAASGQERTKQAGHGAKMTSGPI
jgi:hypothetical protein